MKILSNILILTALAAVGANADIAITLDNPNQAGAPGSVLQFFGTIYNNGSDTVFLNQDSFIFTLIASGYTSDDSADFFANVPISLAGGTNSGDIDLFDLALSDPIGAPDGTYSGTYGLLGGIDGDAQENLVSADFGVTTPEPGFLFILAVAMVILTTIKVRRHRLTS